MSRAGPGALVSPHRGMVPCSISVPGCSPVFTGQRWGLWRGWLLVCAWSEITSESVGELTSSL